MKYKIRQTGKTQKIIEFYISKEIVSAELERIFREISRTATLSGFRTGKAPIELVRKKYKREAKDETVKGLLTDSFKKVINESEMGILGFPEISDLQFDEEKGMSYKATVNVRPQIKLKGYKGLELKRAAQIGKNGVGESEVDKSMQSLREMSAKFLTKEGCAESGEYIVCDVECAVLGHPTETKKNVWLYVGNDAFIPGKELEGLKVSDEKDVDRVLPQDYSRKEVAGKKAKFHVTVKEIKKKILPELNNEFASAMGNFKTVDELQEAIRESIKRKNEIEDRRELESQAMKILDESAVFEVPEFMVDTHLENLVKEAKKRLKEYNPSENEVGSMGKNLTERLKDEAVREVRAFFILDEIAKLENITVSDEELDAAVGMIAASAGRPRDEVKKHYVKNEQMENLREDIRQRKALDFVIKNANVG